MKVKYFCTILSAATLAFLGGCVIVVDGKGDMETEWASTWEAEHDSATAANKKLAREVSAALAADSQLAGEEINVSARRGAVALHGSVSSTAVVDRALQISAAVPGVESVVSRLSVQFTGH